MSQLPRYKTIDPHTGKLTKTFATATDEEVSAAVDKAHKAYNNVWRYTPVSERAALLLRVAALIESHRAEIMETGIAEMGKLFADMHEEMEIIIDICKYYAANIEQLMKTVPVPGVPGAEIITEPLGVILGIEPWNMPFYQVMRVAGPQLAAGNTVLIKPASNVPQSALLLEKLFKDAGTPDGVFQVVLTDIRQLNELIDDFRVRGVTLTGSEAAGRAVAERAGRNLKKVVLELGGSDPLVVLEDANLEEAVRVAFQGRMANMGQICAGLKRFIVVGRERGREFQELFVNSIKDLKIGDPRNSSTVIGPLYSEVGVVELLDQVERAKAAGATVVYGGKRINRAGSYMEPTLITNISRENPLFQEETFGPVASLYVVDTEEEAIELANATSFGLGSAVSSTNIEHAKRVAARIDSGMVFINSHLNTESAVPFGGIKNSGMGRELGELGVNEFVNKKLVRVHKSYL